MKKQYDIQLKIGNTIYGIEECTDIHDHRRYIADIIPAEIPRAKGKTVKKVLKNLKEKYGDSITDVKEYCENASFTYKNGAFHISDEGVISCVDRDYFTYFTDEYWVNCPAPDKIRDNLLNEYGIVAQLVE